MKGAYYNEFDPYRAYGNAIVPQNAAAFIRAAA